MRSQMLKSSVKVRLDIDLPKYYLIMNRWFNLIEVKKIMNAMYKKIKSQIKPEQYYSGNGMLTAMLKIIKAITLQMFQGQEDQEEEVDYFSQHIYQGINSTFI